MSQKKAFDNIMNYFNEGEEEEEEEEEEESNYILNFNMNQKINKKKKGSSLKQINSSLTINSHDEEKITQISDEKINNTVDNNFISYFGNDPSRPETPKLNCDNNNIDNVKEGKQIEFQNKENNNNNEDNNIFSETLETKIKDMNSNSISILENNIDNYEYNETPVTRQTFRKDKNINKDKNYENEDSQKDIRVNEKEEEKKIENIKELDIPKKNINFENLQMSETSNKEKEEENDKIIIKDNLNNINNNLNINNNNNNEIKKKKLFFELQKNKEKLIKFENMNNNNQEEENMILAHNIKDTGSINNSNNINFINFNEMKEIYKDNIEKEKEYIDENNEDKKSNKNNDEVFKKINADNIDELFLPILYNDNNISKENEIKINKSKKDKNIKINKRKNIISKKKLTKSKSLDSFNTKFKMDKLSYKKLSSFNEKLISKIISKNSENNKMISIIGILKSLNDLKVLNLLKEKVDNLDEKDIQKKKELEFLEQIWFLLNPDNKEMIKSEIFEGFIKLIYPYSINLKKNVIEYIKEYIKIVNFMEPKNYIKNNDEYFYNSPLRQKKFNKDEIWTIEKIVQIFFELKMNSIAYKNNYVDMYKEKNISNNNNNCDKKKEKRKNFNFDKLYESFMMKQKITEKTLEIMREAQIKENKEELEKFTYIPKICKKSEKLSNNLNKNKIPVYDKLYIKRNDKKIKIEKIKDEINKDKKEENFSFKPELL